MLPIERNREKLGTMMCLVVLKGMLQLKEVILFSFLSSILAIEKFVNMMYLLVRQA